MSTDALESLSDAELSEVFAVEVAGLEKRIGTPPFPNVKAFYTKGAEFGLPCWDHDVQFATNANAVLPWLEDWSYSACRFWTGDAGHAIQIVLPWTGTMVDGRAKTFPRAACLALIRSKRAKA